MIKEPLELLDSNLMNDDENQDDGAGRYVSRLQV